MDKEKCPKCGQIEEIVDLGVCKKCWNKRLEEMDKYAPLKSGKKREKY